ncbi:hypothetical protein [Kitasatospora sp. NPDC008115]|uniref:hypothetical protein n=1 Tax=Kitasatospora sp. NPDC008115 TaxID=3364022 RepID=UPI0036E5C601
MNITRHPESSVCWIDLGTPDMETATAFYTALFGRAVAPPSPGGYRLCTLRGRLVAAPGPAEDAGATDVRRESDGGVVLGDPTGALFGLTRRPRNARRKSA